MHVGIAPRLALIALLALGLAGCGPSDPPPEPEPPAPVAESSAEIPPTSDAVPEYTIEQFMDTERVFGASFSPDGERVAYSSNRSGVFNVYAQSVAGGEAAQLTDSTTDPKFLQAFFPNDDRLVFSGDQGGNELDHVYVRNPDGSVVDLTPGDKLKANFAGFSADGARLWITTNERDAGVFDLYEYDTGTLARELVMENTVNAFPGPISPDGRYMALGKVHLRSDSDILLWSRETGEITPLVADEGEVANQAATFSDDGSALFYLTDRGSEFTRLIRRDLDSGEETVVLAPEWDARRRRLLRSRAAGTAGRQHHFGRILGRRQPDGVLSQQRPSAQRPVCRRPGRFRGAAEGTDLIAEPRHRARPPGRGRGCAV